jgi:hypothetical protein
MAVLVKEYGVNFELNFDAEKSLRSAEANGDLLLDISQNRRNVSEGTDLESKPSPDKPLAEIGSRISLGISVDEVTAELFERLRLAPLRSQLLNPSTKGEVVTGVTAGKFAASIGLMRNDGIFELTSWR